MRSEVAVPPGAISARSRLATDLQATRRAAASLAFAALLTAIAYGCVAQGGFYPDQQRVLLALTAVSGVFAALVTPARRVLLHFAVAAPLCVCAVIAALVAGDLGGTAPVLGIVGAAAAAALAARTVDGSARQLLLSGLVVAGVALALSGWFGVASRHTPLALVDQGLWRASSTLTYANATAALLAPLALVAIARAIDDPQVRVWRLSAAILAIGVGATLSRAGWAALALGIVVLAWHFGWQKVRTILSVLVGAGIATAGVVATAPTRLPSRPALAIAALGIGLAVSLMPVRHPRRWVAVAVALVCGGLTLGAALSSSRLTVSSPDRGNEWRATWAAVAAHPLTGVGPAHLQLQWHDSSGNTYAAHATHNEFLQLGAEQGVPALAVALTTLVAIGLALVRRRQSVGLAVLVAFAVASAFDFVWHVALLPVVIAAIVGAALPFDDDADELYGRPAPTR